jgi:hypothetical protein
MVAVEIEIWPSSTWFEAGSILQLIIQGYELGDYAFYGHKDLENHGSHRILTGRVAASALVIPVITART